MWSKVEASQEGSSKIKRGTMYMYIHCMFQEIQMCEIPEKCKYSHSPPEVHRERQEIIEKMKMLNGVPTWNTADANARTQSQDARKQSALQTSSSNFPFVDLRMETCSSRPGYAMMWGDKDHQER